MHHMQRRALERHPQAGEVYQFNKVRAKVIGLTMSALKAGDRVEHVLAASGCHGTVEFVDGEHVRVKWDDGKIGCLYFDDKTAARVRNLQRLRADGQDEAKP